GDDDVGEFDWYSLAAGDDALDSLWHCVSFCLRRRVPADADTRSGLSAPRAGRSQSPPYPSSPLSPSCTSALREPASTVSCTAVSGLGIAVGGLRHPPCQAAGAVSGTARSVSGTAR